MSKTYHFVGNGAGVAGLPHRITRQEAQDRGVEKILDAALKNGNYKALVNVLKDEKPKGHKEK